MKPDSPLQFHLAQRQALAVEAAGAATLVVTVRLNAQQAQAQRPGQALPIRFVVTDQAGGHGAQAATTFLPG